MCSSDLNGRRRLLILWPSYLGSRHARPSRLATLRPPSNQSHYPTSLVLWIGQVLPARLQQWQLHLQSQHIKDTGIMLLLLCGVYQIMTLTLCLVKPFVNKLDVGVCRIQLPFKMGKFASPASHQSFHHLHIEAVWLFPWNMILCSSLFLTTTIVSGATIYTGHT